MNGPALDGQGRLAHGFRQGRVGVADAGNVLGAAGELHHRHRLGDQVRRPRAEDVDTQDAIGFALIQMKAETLDKIDAALQRLGEGTYGDCIECGAEIAGARLWALPFAVRCRDCEEARETVERRDRVMAERRGSSALFA